MTAVAESQESVEVMSPARSAVVSALLVALGPMSLAAITPALPSLAQALGISDARAGLAVSLYLAGFAGFQLVSGPVSDSLGRRRTALLFALLYCAGTLFGLVAQGFAELLVARLCQGVGVASGLAVSRALVRDQYRGEAAAFVLSISNILTAVIPLLTPLFGALLLDLTGNWRSVFVLMLGVGLAQLAVILLVMRETLPGEARPGLAPLRLFGAYPAILRDLGFLRPVLSIGLCVGGIYTLSAALPFILMSRLGLSLVQYGIASMTQASAFILGSVISARLVKRLPSATVTGIGIACVGLGGTLFLIEGSRAEASAVPLMITVGIWVTGNGMAFPGLTVSALSRRPGAFGAASGVLGFLQIGFGCVGATVLGLAFADPMRGALTILPVASLTAVAICVLDRVLVARRG